jgi:ubiquinone/menaquinone biosynthesis C-methylase UbiE
MVYFSNKYRSTETEVMDSTELQGKEMRELLNDLKLVNTWLGGFSISLQGIQRLLSKIDTTDPVTIIDLGCGDGAMLRKCAEMAEYMKTRFKLIGVDANPHILEEARQKSISYSNISFIEMDVFSPSIRELNGDIILCTLFLHHFKMNKISELLSEITAIAKVGIVINDLQRSKTAFWLFRIVSRLFLKTKTARHDGLVSIARGFKRRELLYLSGEFLHFKHSITQKWAFRYQWLISKT